VTRYFAVILSLSLAASAIVATSASQAAGNRAEIDKFYAAWMGGAAQKGPAAYAAFYAEEGMMLPPNERPVAGRGPIEEFQRRAQATSPYAVKPSGITVDEVRFLGADWAVYRSTLSGVRIAKADGASTPFETKYFDVLQRGADGQWRVAYRLWSDNLK
jgi:uncharacterized protein (TIGR02246 family)